MAVYKYNPETIKNQYNTEYEENIGITGKNGIGLDELSLISNFRVSWIYLEDYDFYLTTPSYGVSDYIFFNPETDVILSISVYGYNNNLDEYVYNIEYDLLMFKDVVDLTMIKFLPEFGVVDMITKEFKCIDHGLRINTDLETETPGEYGVEILNPVTGLRYYDSYVQCVAIDKDTLKFIDPVDTDFVNADGSWKFPDALRYQRRAWMNRSDISVNDYVTGDIYVDRVYFDIQFKRNNLDFLLRGRT